EVGEPVLVFGVRAEARDPEPRVDWDEARILAPRADRAERRSQRQRLVAEREDGVVGADVEEGPLAGENGEPLCESVLDARGVEQVHLPRSQLRREQRARVDRRKTAERMRDEPVVGSEAAELRDRLGDEGGARL